MSYYISPRFLEKISVHITKNYLNLPQVKVPLILGVHGRKGEGKSFQCELAFERMGIEVIHMSAGELESPDAGDPARLIRMRYREAGDLVKVRGRMAVLMINDLDAGAGRVDQFTQYTVNTQLVNGTLMNIADNPTDVQLPGSYADDVQRVPIVVTGNDLSTLYAPLIRDGRMEKFFWEPSRDDRIGIVSGIFEADEVNRSNIEKLVDTFPQQSIDFFSAIRSRLYDEQVRQLIEAVGLERISMRLVNSTEAPPEFRKPDFSLPHMLEVAELIVREQRRVQEMGLSREYNEALRSPSSRVPDADNSSRREPASQSDRDTSRSASMSSETANRSNQSDSSNGFSASRNGKESRQETKLAPEILEQVRQLLAQGCRVGMEHVNQRRFRTGSWQSCGLLQGEKQSEAIAALEACLAEHSDEYVRLVGIDPKAKRRVVETIIHRPATKAAHS